MITTTATILRTTLLLAIATVTLNTFPAMAADEVNTMITVQTESGREFTADVDPRTNQDRLWLRFTTANTTLLRPITWDSIDTAFYQGERIAIDELRELVDKLRSVPPRQEIAAPSTVEYQAEPANDAAGTAEASFADRATRALGATSRVEFVRIDAFLANWDADVEDDGLVIHIYPQDGNGDIVPINATLDVELIAARHVDFNAVPHGRGQRFDRISRWTKLVDQDQLGLSGVQFKLPFQALHPEFDNDINTHGLVHVRLSIPGHGVFEDSVSPVRIRRFSPVRDQLELTIGGRFFPTERTGRGK